MTNLGLQAVSDRFTNWGSEEPQQGGQDCMIMDGDGLWADVPCGNTGGPRRVVAKYPRELTTTTTQTTTTMTRTTHTVDADQGRSIQDLNDRLDTAVNTISDLTRTVDTMRQTMADTIAALNTTQTTNSQDIARVRQAIARVVGLLPEGRSGDGGAAAPCAGGDCAPPQIVATGTDVSVRATTGTIRLHTAQCGEFDPCAATTFLDQVVTALGEFRGNN